MGLNGTPIFEKLTEHLTFPVATTVALCLVGAALQYVRDIPLRAKVT